MNSINPIQKYLIIGRLDWRPKASKMPMGKEHTMPVTPMVKREHEATKQMVCSNTALSQSRHSSNQARNRVGKLRQTAAYICAQECCPISTAAPATAK